jgi:hypothetical protein
MRPFASLRVTELGLSLTDGFVILNEVKNLWEAIKL